MKLHGILNSDLSAVLSYMRHTDTITVGDCGLPAADGVQCIDLALSFGKPSLMDVVAAVKEDFKAEKIILAEEIKTQNPVVHKQILDLFKNIEIVYVPHTEFKRLTESSKAVVRTGENTPYANIILQSACIFSD